MKDSKRKLGWGTALKRKIKNRYEDEKKKMNEEKQMKTRAQKKGREEALKIREKEMERNYREKQLNRMRSSGVSPAEAQRLKMMGERKGTGKQRKAKVKGHRPEKETADSLKQLYDFMT